MCTTNVPPSLLLTLFVRAWVWAGVTFEGNRSDVLYNITVQGSAGKSLKINVDWNVTTSLTSGFDQLTVEQLQAVRFTLTQ